MTLNAGDPLVPLVLHYPFELGLDGEPYPGSAAVNKHYFLSSANVRLGLSRLFPRFDSLTRQNVLQKLKEVSATSHAAIAAEEQGGAGGFKVLNTYLKLYLIQLVGKQISLWGFGHENLRLQIDHHGHTQEVLLQDYQYQCPLAVSMRRRIIDAKSATTINPESTASTGAQTNPDATEEEMKTWEDLLASFEYRLRRLLEGIVTCHTNTETIHHHILTNPSIPDQESLILKTRKILRTFRRRLKRNVSKVQNILPSHVTIGDDNATAEHEESGVNGQDDTTVSYYGETNGDTDSDSDTLIDEKLSEEYIRTSLAPSYLSLDDAISMNELEEKVEDSIIGLMANLDGDSEYGNGLMRLMNTENFVSLSITREPEAEELRHKSPIPATEGDFNPESRLPSSKLKSADSEDLKSEVEVGQVSSSRGSIETTHQLSLVQSLKSEAQVQSDSNMEDINIISKKASEPTSIFATKNPFSLLCESTIRPSSMTSQTRSMDHPRKRPNRGAKGESRPHTARRRRKEEKPAHNSQNTSQHATLVNSPWWRKMSTVPVKKTVKPLQTEKTAISKTQKGTHSSYADAVKLPLKPLPKTCQKSIDHDGLDGSVKSTELIKSVANSEHHLTEPTLDIKAIALGKIEEIPSRENLRRIHHQSAKPLTDKNALQDQIPQLNPESTHDKGKPNKENISAPIPVEEVESAECCVLPANMPKEPSNCPSQLENKEVIQNGGNTHGVGDIGPSLLHSATNFQEPELQIEISSQTGVPQRNDSAHRSSQDSHSQNSLKREKPGTEAERDKRDFDEARDTTKEMRPNSSDVAAGLGEKCALGNTIVGFQPPQRSQIQTIPPYAPSRPYPPGPLNPMGSFAPQLPPGPFFQGRPDIPPSFSAPFNPYAPQVVPQYEYFQADTRRAHSERLLGLLKHGTSDYRYSRAHGLEPTVQTPLMVHPPKQAPKHYCSPDSAAESLHTRNLAPRKYPKGRKSVQDSNASHFTKEKDDLKMTCNAPNVVAAAVTRIAQQPQVLLRQYMALRELRPSVDVWTNQNHTLQSNGEGGSIRETQKIVLEQNVAYVTEVCRVRWVKQPELLEWIIHCKTYTETIIERIFDPWEVELWGYSLLKRVMISLQAERGYQT